MILNQLLYIIEDNWEQGFLNLSIQSFMNHASHRVEEGGKLTKLECHFDIIFFLQLHDIIKFLNFIDR